MYENSDGEYEQVQITQKDWGYAWGKGFFEGFLIYPIAFVIDSITMGFVGGDTSILVERIVNRRSCPVCGEIYNLEFKPPKVEGHCDKDGAELTQRKDDTREVAQSRFDTYNKETAPLIDYYTKKGVLKSINANGTIDEVWERLLEVIN